MSLSTSRRHLEREARQRQRLKARLEAWWHVERRPAARVFKPTAGGHRAHVALPDELRDMLIESLRQLDEVPPDAPTH